eukprot:3941980-Rhodomonas_salina.3
MSGTDIGSGYLPMLCPNLTPYAMSRTDIGDVGTRGACAVLTYAMLLQLPAKQLITMAPSFTTAMPREGVFVMQVDPRP